MADTGVAHQTSDAPGLCRVLAHHSLAEGAGAELCDACTTPEGPRQDPGKGNPGQCYSEWILDSSQGKRDEILKRTHYLRMQPLN